MTWPSVCILLLTYEDGQRGTAERTLRAVLDHVRYSGPLHVHIADDGSVSGHVDALRAIASGYAAVATVGATNAGRRGYGASYNLATQAIHGAHPIVLPLEDDWELRRPLDLDPLVSTIKADNGIECIRLGYLGHTQDLHGTVIHTHAGQMLVIDSDSPERHVAAGHPRIETVAWERRVGPWAEGLAAGMTEFEWCGRFAARRGVAWPMDLVRPYGDLFGHIGAHGLGEIEPGMEVTDAVSR